MKTIIVLLSTMLAGCGGINQVSEPLDPDCDAKSIAATATMNPGAFSGIRQGQVYVACVKAKRGY